MANTNKQFQDFDENLSIPMSKRQKMSESREATRDRISLWFKNNQPEYPISFWIQGSHKNSLNIRTEGDNCDQDDGIYVDRNPEDSVDGTTLQEWIFEALEGSTSTTPEHKPRCIRNFYKPNNLGTFHIDYPSYYKTEDMFHPMLTVKNGELEESDPKEFTEWLKDITDDEGQLRRLIRYLKGWADYKSKSIDMPNGLTLTVLACNSYVAVDSRDDEALYETLQGIQSALQTEWECIMPSTPHDDLLANTDYTFRVNFMNSLSDLISDAEEALEVSSKHKASKLWKKHMGTRYPLAPEENTVGNRAALAGLIGNNKPYFDDRGSIR